MTIIKRIIILLLTVLHVGIGSRLLGINQWLSNDLLHDTEHLAHNLITLNLYHGRHDLSDHFLELLETRLKLQLATKLWSPASATDDKPLTAERLALIAHAIKTTCSDPTKFYGENLIQLISNIINEHNVTADEDKDVVSPIVDLMQCLHSATAEEFERYLGTVRLAHLVNKTSTGDEHSNQTKSTDSLAFKSLAIGCYLKLRPDDADLSHVLNDLMASLLVRQDPDGSFDNSTTTTALVIQAVTETGRQRYNFLWNKKAAINYVHAKARQGMLTALEAFYVVPAFHESWSHVRCRKLNRRVARPELAVAGFLGATRATSTSSDEEAKSIVAPVLEWVFSGRNRQQRHLIGDESEDVLDKNVTLTLSRWISDQNETQHVVVNVHQGSPLLSAIKSVARKHTDINYDTNSTVTSDQKSWWETYFG